VNPMSNEIAELRAMRVPELVERYAAVFGKPPRCKQPTWLWRRIAWKLQEQRFGGLSVAAKARLEELIAEIELPRGTGRVVCETVKRVGSTTPGTTVSRFWKGRQIRATAVEGGWEHEGTFYKSLSAVAKTITGSHWNGKLFFGLTRRAK
jgi:hypothetical protein